MEIFKTDKIFETDGHCKNFEAEVLWCEENSDGMFDVILNRTAFFPEGGGQSSDEGTIDGQEVIFLRLENNETTIVHTVKKPIPVGKLVYGEINMKERFSRMQNHTAEHICSGIIYSLYGFNNIGFHMGQDEITMDFDGLFTQEQINNIEFLANEAVYKNVPVKFSFYKPNEADSIFYRSKKKIETTLRLVEIEGIDVCACCAPHVSRTGEIGVIKILSSQKYKGGTRISLLAGERAFTELNKHFNNVKKITNSLSSNMNDICERFEQIQKELSEVKIAKTAAKQQYYSLLASTYQDNCHDNILFFDENATVEEMRFFVNLLMSKTSKVCAFFSGFDGNFKFIAGSTSEDMTKIAQALRTNLHASCGGKMQMIQGSVCVSKNEINNFFENMLF